MQAQAARIPRQAANRGAGMSQSITPEWEKTLLARLPLFGHRNWIVVVDAAYPLQSNPGIETIVCSEPQIEVARRVMESIAASAHVRATIYTDAELAYLQEENAPGIEHFRRQLSELLQQQPVCQVSHEEIIGKLDKAATLFRVLVVKTNMVLPYTSVFFELDCGYWNADAEQKLRAAMQSANTP
jgi:L-fucose mutarotase/ribose pyranase (RbsD/FucU family)